MRGPRLQISLTMLSQTGGHGDGLAALGVRSVGSSPRIAGVPSSSSTVERRRRKVRELVRNGADVIKIATSGGVLSPTDSPEQRRLRADEIEVIVAEARAARALQ